MNKLMIPGPIDLEPDVLTTLSEQMIPHYGPKWVQSYTQARNRIRRYAETESDVFLLSGSGSSNLYAAVGTCFGPGEKVLVVVNGDTRYPHHTNRTYEQTSLWTILQPTTCRR